MELKKEFVAMLNRLATLPGGKSVERLAETLATTEPSVSIRLNSRKTDGFVAGELLRPVAWAERGYYVDGERPKFTLDPAMHQGLYYVQDASSMAIATIVGQLTDGDNPIIYIDMCAAPGGKTTAAIDALPDESLVIANEYDRKRSEILRENVIKWGYPNVVITQGDTSRYASVGEIADIVAVDAPCSGEGMMRKEAMAVEQWSPGLVGECASLQREILDNAWRALKPGGYLIYSTCTFNLTEDEENLEYIIKKLGGDPISVDFPHDCGIAGAIGSEYPAYRFIPGRIDGEGLFACVVRKPMTDSQTTKQDSKGRKPGRAEKGAKPMQFKLPFALNESDRFEITVNGDTIVAYPKAWLPVVKELRDKLNVIYAGVELAQIKGRDAMPLQSAALSQILDCESVNCLEVDYMTAIAYLRGEALRLDDDRKGFLLLTYHGQPLGFVKNLGSRANNLYPSPWSIRTTHVQPTDEINGIFVQQ